MITFTVTTATELENAISNALDGNVIYIENGSYDLSNSLVINKEIVLVGESKDNVVIRDTRGNSLFFVQVSTDNVVIQDLTIEHITTDVNIGIAVVASGGGFPQTRIDKFMMYNVKVKYSKGAVAVRSDNFVFESCTFQVVAGSGTRRGVLHYGNGGTSFIKNNIFINESGSNLNAIYPTSTTGNNLNESQQGSLVVEGNTFQGTLNQFIIMDNHQGTADAFELIVKDNITPESNGFVVSYGTSINFGDVFSRMVFVGNSLKNPGKGLYAIDGTSGSYRSVGLEVISQDNVLESLTLRIDYSETSGSTGSIAAYKTSAFDSAPVVLLCPFDVEENTNVPSDIPSDIPSSVSLLECSEPPIDVPSPPTLPDYTAMITFTVTTATELENAISNALDGNVIYIENGSYDLSNSLVINKEIVLVGESKDNVVIRDTRGNSLFFVQVSTDNVVIQDLTIEHITTDVNIGIAVVASGGGFPQTRIDKFMMYNVKVKYSKGAVAVRSDNFVFESCTFQVVAGSGTRRGVLHYGNGGTSFIKNNIFINESGSNLNAIYPTSTTGNNLNESQQGSLVVEGNTFQGTLNQFIIMDNHQGTADAFELIVKDNITPESNGFVVSYGTSINFGDVFSRMVFVGNSLKNPGKGLYAIDGTSGSYRSVGLEVISQDNVLESLTLRIDYSETSGSTGSIAAYKTSAFDSAPVVLLCPFDVEENTNVPSNEPSRAPTRKPTRRPTGAPTTSQPTPSPSYHPTLAPSPLPSKQPVPSPVETFASVNICGSCNELLLRSPFEQTINDNLSSGTSAVIIESIPNCSSCGVTRNLASESIVFVLKITQDLPPPGNNPEDEEPPPDPSEVIEDLNIKKEELSGIISAAIGKEVEIDGEAVIIEAPSNKPSLSPAPSVSYAPTLSQSPTLRNQPSSRPTKSLNPSSMPSTSASQTFQIKSSSDFDDSEREFCLNAMNIKVGRRIKMRPCKSGFRKQMWFIDNYDQLRLRQYPNFCARYKRRDIRLGICDDNGSTKRRAQFFFDKSNGELYVQKPKRKVYVGFRPNDIYGPVRLFVYGANDSLDKWYLN